MLGLEVVQFDVLASGCACSRYRWLSTSQGVRTTRAETGKNAVTRGAERSVVIVS
jgi:hypothetical protein